MINYKNKLHTRLRYGTPQAVTKLIDRGANVDAISEYGQLTFYYASQNSHYSEELTKLLLKHGGHRGYELRDSPLHMLARWGTINLTRLILFYDPIRNLVDESKPLVYIDGNDTFMKTPLYHCFMFQCSEKNDRDELIWQQNRLDMCEYLLSHGANVNAQTERGNTPLHTLIYCASSYFDEYSKMYNKRSVLKSQRICSIFQQFIQILIDFGADCNMLNNQKMNPIDNLIEKNRPHEVIKVMLDCALANFKSSKRDFIQVLTNVCPLLGIGSTQDIAQLIFAYVPAVRSVLYSRNSINEILPRFNLL